MLIQTLGLLGVIVLLIYGLMQWLETMLDQVALDEPLSDTYHHDDPEA